MARPSSKRYKVGFYQVEPRDTVHPWDGFPMFPRGPVLDTVRELNLSAKQGYSKVNLFDELMCKVYGEREPRMLAAYRVDRVNAPRGELGGIIEQIPMKKGQGIARPSYAMFFEPDVMALLRPTTDAPGAGQIAAYLADWAKIDVFLSSIATKDALAKLQRDPSDILRVNLRIAGRNIERITEEAGDVIEALRAAAKVGNSSMVALALGVELRREREPWWNRMRRRLEVLNRTGSLELFESAVIECSDRDLVNLLEDRITTSVQIPLAAGSKQLDEEAAAQALVQAYVDQQSVIAAALDRPPAAAAS